MCKRFVNYKKAALNVNILLLLKGIEYFQGKVSAGDRKYILPPTHQPLLVNLNPDLVGCFLSGMLKTTGACSLYLKLLVRLIPRFPALTHQLIQSTEGTLKHLVFLFPPLLFCFSLCPPYYNSYFLFTSPSSFPYNSL